MRLVKLLPIISGLYLSGCLDSSAIPTPKLRAIHVSKIARQAGWQEHTINTAFFTLKAYGFSASIKSKTLTIYIEGDGLAWLSADRPSNNPTPMVPIGLNIALHDKKHQPIVYLSRPCQLVFKDEWRTCRQEYWTNLRFSPAVIYSMNQAVDYVKKYYHAQNIVLIGYSGGGTIATLLAAKRHDVVRLITVAAILDIEYWVRQENLTPLSGSLNPADAWQKLIAIPQTHFVGGKDAVVTADVAREFAKRFPVAKQPSIKVIQSFDHTCCWAQDWMSLL